MSAAAFIKKTDGFSQADISVIPQGLARYVVPQKITRACDVKLYFRVSDVCRDVTIQIKDGGRVILSRKKQKVAPGEMETVTLKHDLIEKMSGRELIVEVIKQ